MTRPAMRYCYGCGVGLEADLARTYEHAQWDPATRPLLLEMCRLGSATYRRIVVTGLCWICNHLKISVEREDSYS
jgi:hypothetical protein